jgi:glycosyltransferase involved in cell wall biosynthesis
MRILIVAPTYLPSRRANTIQIMKMAQALTKLGYDVLVLVPDTHQEGHKKWEVLSPHYGLDYEFDIKWIKVGAKLRSYDYGVKAVWKFRKVNADILYTRLPQAAAVASKINIPTIFEVHDIPSGTMGPILFRQFLKGRGANRLVLITHSLRDAIARKITPLPTGPFTIVQPDGVDLMRYEKILAPVNARMSLKEMNLIKLPINRITAGYTGHLYPGRGIELILEIASHIQDITFLVVGGDPPAVTRVKNNVEKKGLTNVVLTGFVPNSDLPRYQAACDVLLMPYQQNVEGSSGGNIAEYLSPMKLFEYMACGRVILSSRLRVLEEILSDDNAILLPSKGINAWVNTLRFIRDNPGASRKLAMQARNDAKKYSWETRAERIFDKVN